MGRTQINQLIRAMNQSEQQGLGILSASIRQALKALAHGDAETAVARLREAVRFSEVAQSSCDTNIVTFAFAVKQVLEKILATELDNQQTQAKIEV